MRRALTLALAAGLAVTPLVGAVATQTALPTAAAPQRQLPGSQEPRTRHATDPGLESRIARQMSRSTSSRYDVVVDIEGVGRVVSLHPGRALRPASTQKLFTTLPLLLDRAGDSLVTDVVAAGAPVAGVVTGDLVVRASDDPSLTKHDLGVLAHRVHAAGVDRVTGRLVLDIGSLPTNTQQPGWKPDFVPADIGPLSPFPVHRDDWRVDSSYLRHPTAANLDVFRKRLTANHVHVNGGDAIVRSTSAKVVLATHRSAALRNLITHTLRESDNFYAESFLAVAGGHTAVNRVAETAGVTDTSSATDGSGLSYDDRQSARGEVTLLGYAHTTSAAADLVHALSVACRNGTLEHRFCHTDGAGEVFAKTGTLSRTSALAGYTTDALGRWVTFAVIAGKVRNISAAQRAIDRAVLVLRHYSGSQ